MSAKRTKAAAPKRRLLFVCTGNTCRSAMAERIMKYVLAKKHKLSSVTVSSAGLCASEGEPMTATAAEALKSLKIKPRPHAARQLTAEMANNSDLIVCMTAEHKRALERLGDKVKTVGEITGAHDVPDPYGQSLDVYKSVAKYLLYACGDIYELL